MKTRKHGNGLSHKEVIKFSNRLATQGIHKTSTHLNYLEGFERGWSEACKYFAHELRTKLREQEKQAEYGNY